ncbi:GDP-Man:Man(3)GlcNAc(2)-PP-Dol alpha-1,2-mannosyltransferase [Anaeramoeba flamelloides]|uniref:GDP-Man:Man(3)GlcNAc(2)-PP-Dol alpha-1,2-mannosyltransferase n=1 Tax=Anaeramoeba flamelloides TaxID=1746091 RepID=A0ABQ8YSZ1_9EUKA|nr:GDP-Man:Man(3)GlcNAc(2)-PP-Dol alpha-1,2-mannosyltransferase [Anaeramoeba flamelloides]
MISLQFIIVILNFVVTIFVLRYTTKQKMKKRSQKSIGFFHPFANDCGGGERVLWYSVLSLQKNEPELEIVIYTVSDVSKEDILKKVHDRFGITIKESNLKFIRIKYGILISAKLYPRFTLIGQSLGGMLLGVVSVILYPVDLFFDSTGHAFTFPIAKLLGIKKVGCYVHYPTISTDMLSRVQKQSNLYNNSGLVAKSKIFSTLKLVYYKLFALCYRFTGKFADLVITNGTWTQNHIIQLWGSDDKRPIRKIYPPCDTIFKKLAPETIENSNNEKSNSENSNNENPNVSDGGSNDKKDTTKIINEHNDEKKKKKKKKKLCILFLLVNLDQKKITSCKESFEKMLNQYNGDKIPILVCVGSCRNREDEQRIELLKKLVLEKKLQDSIQFRVNVSYQELLNWLQRAIAGLHTMRDEHFGICVVEYMANKVIPIAHNSAGPKLDIVTPFKCKPTGFLAETCEQYCNCILKVLQMNDTQRKELTKNAYNSIQRFENQEYIKEFNQLISELF